jgi:hypothetical protein
MICLSFCEEIYKECINAEYDGRTIGDVYKSGVRFCQAQNFEVVRSNKQCFTYDPEVFSKSMKTLSNNLLITFTLLFLLCFV